MLNIKDAIMLYNILKDHLPEREDINLYEYAKEIIKNINESERYDDYIDAVELMSSNVVLDKEVEDIFELFVRGLLDNNIISLKIFCKGLEYGR